MGAYLAEGEREKGDDRHEYQYSRLALNLAQNPPWCHGRISLCFLVSCFSCECGERGGISWHPARVVIQRSDGQGWRAYLAEGEREKGDDSHEYQYSRLALNLAQNLHRGSRATMRWARSTLGVKAIRKRSRGNFSGEVSHTPAGWTFSLQASDEPTGTTGCLLFLPLTVTGCVAPSASNILTHIAAAFPLAPLDRLESHVHSPEPVPQAGPRER